MRRCSSYVAVDSLDVTLEEQSMAVHEKAARIAGNSSYGWNRRFSDAIEAQGWEILPLDKGQKFQEGDIPIWTVQPNELDDTGWRFPYPSMVVPKGWQPKYTLEEATQIPLTLPLLSRALWTLRYYVARRLIGTGMRVMPPGRYRNELSAALWTLGLKVQATVVAKRAKRV